MVFINDQKNHTARKCVLLATRKLPTPKKFTSYKPQAGSGAGKKGSKQQVASGNRALASVWHTMQHLKSGDCTL
jgi:hypothetical protein